MTRTDRRQRKEREETGELQGTGNPGESGRGGRREERGGPEPPSDGNNSTLNFKGQSLGISQAAVRGMEQHQPIMDKLGDPGGQTCRQTAKSKSINISMKWKQWYIKTDNNILKINWLQKSG